jgi:hypothetical protein
MADVFSVLGADHAEVKHMLLALENSPGNFDGAGQTVLAARYEVMQRLVRGSTSSWPSSSRQPASTSTTRNSPEGMNGNQGG